MTFVRKAQQLLMQILFSVWKRKMIFLFFGLVSTLLLVASQFGSGRNGGSVVNERSRQLGGNNRNLNDHNLERPLIREQQSSPAQWKKQDLSQAAPSVLIKEIGPDPDMEPDNSNNSLDHAAAAADPAAAAAAVVVDVKSDVNKVQENSNIAAPDTFNDLLNSKHVFHNPYIPSLRIVHLDLKGAPPKLEYLKEFFDLIKKAGANGILLEYEDTFPFQAPIAEIKTTNAYTREQVLEIIQLCAKYEFELIPLVQTFGHLEFALKLHKFRHLREVDKYPTAVCPSNNASFNSLIKPIIDQVIELHQQSGYPIRYLHIGCDEVFHIARCPLCQNQDRDDLFLAHVRKVAQYVKDEHHLTPIIWDDMLRTIAEDKLPQLSKLVEIMIWTYIKDIYRFIPFFTWKQFGNVFDGVWGASAFKGAFGETLIVPDANLHLENNIAWLEALSEQQSTFKNVRGLVLTGWQRYDHLAVLCELLPAGTPSLIVNLLTATLGGFEQDKIWKRFDDVMKCLPRSYYQQHLERNGLPSSSTPSSHLGTDQYLYVRASTCNFPGSEIFRLTQQLTELIKRVNDYVYDVNVHKAWLTDYNFRHNYSSPSRIEEQLQESESILSSLEYFIREASRQLSRVYDKYTTAEWIEQNVYPYVLKIKHIQDEAQRISSVREWSQRPLTPLKELKQYGVEV